ncbi:MAG: hypothetical protein JNJ69_11200 [Leptospiraceae bacterium]|nr:hypothetical protein [Leptospiraceae bacterium]
MESDQDCRLAQAANLFYNNALLRDETGAQMFAALDSETFERAPKRKKGDGDRRGYTPTYDVSLW